MLKGLEYGTTRHLHCKYLMVTHGILAHQFTPEERGLDVSRFRGPVSMAGKHNGVDCVVGTQDLTGKVCSAAAHSLQWSCRVLILSMNSTWAGGHPAKASLTATNLQAIASSSLY